MAAPGSKLLVEYEKWFRVATLIDFAGRNLCYKVIHVDENIPTDGAKLYQELISLKSQICRYQSQHEVLCPSSGITDERKFDLTLYTSIIEKKFPRKYDQLVADLRQSRNTEFHRGDKSLSDKEFDQLWNETTQMLVSHGFDIQLVGDLKTCDLSSTQKFNDSVMNILQGMVDNTFSKYLEASKDFKLFSNLCFFDRKILVDSKHFLFNKHLLVLLSDSRTRYGWLLFCVRP